MLDRLLPRSADNTYRGHTVALWLFGVVVFMRLGMSFGSMFAGQSMASGPDAIPLDTYTPAAAQAVISIFALLGLATLVICLMCVVVLARYRSLVPLMFVLLFVQIAGGRIILWLLPIERHATPYAFYINLGLIVVIAMGFLLSLGAPRRRSVRL